MLWLVTARRPGRWHQLAQGGGVLEGAASPAPARRPARAARRARRSRRAGSRARGTRRCRPRCGRGRLALGKGPELAFAAGVDFCRRRRIERSPPRARLVAVAPAVQRQLVALAAAQALRESIVARASPARRGGAAPPAASSGRRATSATAARVRMQAARVDEATSCRTTQTKRSLSNWLGVAASMASAQGAGGTPSGERARLACRSRRLAAEQAPIVVQQAGEDPLPVGFLGAGPGRRAAAPRDRPQAAPRSPRRTRRRRRARRRGPRRLRPTRPGLRPCAARPACRRPSPRAPTGRRSPGRRRGRRRRHRPGSRPAVPGRR